MNACVCMYVHVCACMCMCVQVNDKIYVESRQVHVCGQVSACMSCLCM